MDVQNIAASATLVKIIDILRAERELPPLLADPLRFELCQRDVTGVGRHQWELRSASIVERVDLVRVRGEARCRAHLFDSMVLPQTLCVTKGGKAALGRYSGACQDQDVGC